MIDLRQKNQGTQTPQFERSAFCFKRAIRRCFCFRSFAYASSGVSEPRQSMNFRLSFASRFSMNLLEYFDMSELLGMYLRKILLRFSMLGFCHGECGKQKYIFTPSRFSSF